MDPQSTPKAALVPFVSGTPEARRGHEVVPTTSTLVDLAWRAMVVVVHQAGATLLQVESSGSLSDGHDLAVEAHPHL